MYPKFHLSREYLCSQMFQTFLKYPKQCQTYHYCRIPPNSQKYQKNRMSQKYPKCLLLPKNH